MNTRLLASLGLLLLSLLLAPLLPGIINRVKARIGGRQGRPVLQLYYDLRKLVRKSPVYPAAASWVFKAGPMAALAAMIASLFIVPFGGFDSVYPFPGDFLLLAGFLTLARMALILAALDTGSAFEGMGAAREALFSAMAEPVFLFCMAVLAYESDQLSLAKMLGSISLTIWANQWPFFMLLAFALFLLLLVENSRIPVDDPNTHLELTMIHEVMALDHSGPDLALVEYASALKLWIFCLIISGVVLPVPYAPFFSSAGLLEAGGALGLLINGGGTLAIVLATAMVVGIVESLMARLRMERVSQVMTLAASFTGLAALVLWR